MFCNVSKSTINLSALISFLLFALSVTLIFFSSLFALSFTFIIVLRCLQIYYQTINFVFFTFCIEFNSNFLFFTFCIEFHFYKCFAMSPNLLSTYQLLCFFILFALSVTLTFFSSLFALSFPFISVLRCLQIYY